MPCGMPWDERGRQIAEPLAVGWPEGAGSMLRGLWRIWLRCCRLLDELGEVGGNGRRSAPPVRAARNGPLVHARSGWYATFALNGHRRAADQGLQLSQIGHGFLRPCTSPPLLWDARLGPLGRFPVPRDGENAIGLKLTSMDVRNDARSEHVVDRVSSALEFVIFIAVLIIVI